MLADHQISAVAAACERLRRYRGVLLADEVGLGKSFVAAAVAASYRREGSAVDLVVPAALTGQWRQTLEEFGVDAHVVTHTALAAEPFMADPERARLVIVDEAHAFRNPQTQRYAALARRTAGARVLLVTATPFCNSPRDLHALLAMIVPDDAVAARGVPSIDAAFAARDRAAIAVTLEELMIRRGRDVLDDALRFGDVERRVVRFPLFEADGDVRRLIDSLNFPLIGSSPLLRRFLWRRLESSEAALVESIRRQVRFYERALESMAGGRTLTKRDYRRLFGREEDHEAFQQILFWGGWASTATEKISADAIRAEVARLTALRQSVLRSPREKERILVALCESIDEPLLIYTSSRATARALAAAIAPLRRCGVVTSRERASSGAVLRAFQEGALDAIVATDLASEGLNLQRAGAVIHYDIPWNPVRLDQRNGRAMRIGQHRPSIAAWYFLAEDDPTRIARVVSAKNRMRRQLLVPAGGTVGKLASHSSIRPRVAATAACARLPDRVRDLLPPSVDRRHKAGVERLIAEIAGEYLDEARLDYLRSILAAEAPI